MTSREPLPAKPRSRWSWFSFTIGVILGALISVATPTAFRSMVPPDRTAALTYSAPADNSIGTLRESSMGEVLQIAEDSLLHIRQTLDDYTAILVKQETVDGVLSETNELAVKVQCPHRGGKLDESAPMRVYLRFHKPSDIAGREVIWAKDLHDGKLVVHEAGLLGLMTVRLDPTGLLAMRGQRYPVYDIGLTNLVHKLLERGEVDRHNPDVKVTITSGIQFDGRDSELIVVNRQRPSGAENDFSRAEICFDVARRLPLRYTAYGWSHDSTAAPLIETYSYTDIQTNVGLTELDFDPENPSYQFP